jgi:hypothetical protein
VFDVTDVSKAASKLPVIGVPQPDEMTIDSNIVDQHARRHLKAMGGVDGALNDYHTATRGKISAAQQGRKSTYNFLRSYDHAALLHSHPLGTKFYRRELRDWSGDSDNAVALNAWAKYKFGNKATRQRSRDSYWDDETNNTFGADEEELGSIDASVKAVQHVTRHVDPTYDPRTDTVELYRGVDNSYARKIEQATRSKGGFQGRHYALESWSTHPSSASNFGHIILRRRVPVGKIAATYHTGLGQANQDEHEYVVGSGPNPITYKRGNVISGRKRAREAGSNTHRLWSNYYADSLGVPGWEWPITQAYHPHVPGYYEVGRHPSTWSEPEEIIHDDYN